jgi:hypothetical protein
MCISGFKQKSDSFGILWKYLMNSVAIWYQTKFEPVKLMNKQKNGKGQLLS